MSRKWTGSGPPPAHFQLTSSAEPSSHYVSKLPQSASPPQSLRPAPHCSAHFCLARSAGSRECRVEWSESKLGAHCRVPTCNAFVMPELSTYRPPCTAPRSCIMVASAPRSRGASVISWRIEAILRWIRAESMTSERQSRWRQGEEQPFTLNERSHSP